MLKILQKKLYQWKIPALIFLFPFIKLLRTPLTTTMRFPNFTCAVVGAKGSFCHQGLQSDAFISCQKSARGNSNPRLQLTNLSIYRQCDRHSDQKEMNTHHHGRMIRTISKKLSFYRTRQVQNILNSGEPAKILPEHERCSRKSTVHVKISLEFYLAINSVITFLNFFSI